MESWTAARWTARCALALFVAGESLRLARTNDPSSASSVGAVRWSDRLLGGAVGAYLLHVAVALFWVHGGSHAAAWEHTAEQTAQWTGWRTGGGLYVNYAFTLLVCAAVAIETPPLRRAARIAAWFLAIQGGVVFAAAPAKWANLSLLVGGPLLGTAWRTRQTRGRARSTSA